MIGEASFEDWICNLYGVMAKRYHSEDGVFVSDHFRSDCQGKKQNRSFSGITTKHHNGESDRVIQNISYWCQKMMTHADLNWPDDNADSVLLW